jgi:hypothetical protein
MGALLPARDGDASQLELQNAPTTATRKDKRSHKGRRQMGEPTDYCAPEALCISILGLSVPCACLLCLQASAPSAFYEECLCLLLLPLCCCLLVFCRGLLHDTFVSVAYQASDLVPWLVWRAKQLARQLQQQHAELP